MVSSHHPYRLHIRILSAVMLCAFLYLYIGSTVFVHTHEVDGQKVAHSHPYSAPHQHGNGHQIITLAQMGAVLTTPPVAFSLNVQLQVVKEPWLLFSKVSVCAVELTSLIPRAPPVFSLIY